MVTPLFVEWHRFLGSPLSTHMMKILDENRRRWVEQEKAEQAEETQTELSDADAEEREEEERQESVGTGLVVTGQPTARDFMPSPPKYQQYKMTKSSTPSDIFAQKCFREVRRQSLAVPTLESLGVRRHSVPVNIEQSLPRTIYRRESLPTGRGTAFARSPVSPQTESRASSGLREEDELLRYGSQSSDISSSSPHHSSAEEGPGGEDERPLSAENLLPEPSIASMTAEQTAVCRLAEVLQEDSKSNSSHGSCDNISSSNGNNRGGPSGSAVHPPVYPIPSIAVLSPNNGRPPELLLGGVPSPQAPPASGTPAPPTVVIQKPPGSGGGNKREPDREAGRTRPSKWSSLAIHPGNGTRKKT
nr:unnamed protein product [Callosobruchus analis]